MVLFPTFEEGFGLPLLEAMSFHAPVIASTDPALREVSNGASTVTHLDPTDATAWRAALAMAVATDQTADRAAAPPEVPAGAITWAEHADRLVHRARAIV